MALPVLTKCSHVEPLSPKQALKKVSEMAQNGDIATVKALLKNENAVVAELTYAYGDLVVADGMFRLPGMQSPLNNLPLSPPATTRESVTCKECKDLQAYFNKDDNPVPLLLNLERELEVFRIYTDVYVNARGDDGFGYRTVPVAHRKHGELIGVFENLRPPTHSPFYGSFYVSAGSRNVHLVLPLALRTSTLADRAKLKAAFSKDVRHMAKEMDQKEYGLQENFVPSSNPNSPAVDFRLDGVASDWRIIRTVRDNFIDKPKWKSSLLMILVDRPSLLQKPEMALALYKTGFYQLQEPLEAFAGEGPSHGSDIGIFMNVDKPSVPAVWNHLCGCITGRSFVHVPSVKDDDKGPWGELFAAMANCDRAENEITVHRYLPLILKPAKLGSSEERGFVSFNHLLIPQGLFLGAGGNDKWAAKGKFDSRLRDRHILELTKEYPSVIDRKPEEDVRILEGIKKRCWPGTAIGAQVQRAFAVLPGDGDKLSRHTCLKEFMTVRYIKAIGLPDNTGAAPA